jgi:hypothetical protein
MQSFLALITPMGGGGGSPPGIWGGGGVGNYPDAGFPGPQPGGPTHIWGGPFDPPRVWGGKPPYMDIGFPGPQPPGTPPLGIWGGSGVGDYIDAGGPGPQPGGPVRPTHPIYYPPVIWDPARPANPIVNPGDPDHPGAGQPMPKIEWKTAWSPTTGWVVVGVPTGPVPTPSAS